MTVSPLSQDASRTLRQIESLEIGWHLGNDVAWSVAGDDAEARKDVSKVLDRLYLDGSLQRMFIYSRGRPQAAYLIEGNLRDLAEAAES